MGARRGQSRQARPRQAKPRQAKPNKAKPNKAKPREKGPTEKAAIPATCLRVIGGRLRGRLFAYHGESSTRPMKQRVREATFNLVGPRAEGTHVVDLFAGTGALAWEALSRGAESATLVERHFPTARLISKNAAALEVADRIEVIAGDTFIWAKDRMPTTLQRHLSHPWLVFCSPPYELFVSHLDPMMELIEKVGAMAPSGSLMLVEADDRFDMDDLPDRFEWDVRNYSPAVVAIGGAGNR